MSLLRSVTCTTPSFVYLNGEVSFITKKEKSNINLKQSFDDRDWFYFAGQQSALQKQNIGNELFI